MYGFSAYLWPTIALEKRAALGPVHRFWGLATWGTGMAAAAVSIGGQHVAFWVALVDSPERFSLGTILILPEKCVMGNFDMLSGQNQSINLIRPRMCMNGISIQQKR